MPKGKKVCFCNDIKIYDIPYENRVNEIFLNSLHFKMRIKNFEKIFLSCKRGKQLIKEIKYIL